MANVEDLRIVIEPDGTIRAVHSDALMAVLDEFADSEVTRASHVEPYPFGTGWMADMGPSGGPVLFADGACHAADIGSAGLSPFRTRAAALAAEREWLRRERGI